MSEKLLPCPFCGGAADFEEVKPMGGDFTYWSVGCQSSESDCIGYQMLAHYNRKSEAAEAWNKRAPSVASLRPRPGNCLDPSGCLWRHIPTAPEIGLHLCSRAGCPNTTAAISLPLAFDERS
jgi:hypothetical protein